MIDTQIKPVSFSASVLLRPKMHTRGGTFAEIIAFLEGYHNGMAKGNPYAPPVLAWEAFRCWLAAQLQVNADEVFDTLHRQCNSDQTALSKLTLHLTQFEENKAI